VTFISSIKYLKPEAHRPYVAERLLALKDRLRQEIHGVSDERSLRLATWNIMHFGDGGAYSRTAESLLYIAEIIDHFDLVAIQEINEDLTALDTLFRYHLGGDWDYIVTDTTGGSKGNSERLAYAYRKSKVSFRKEAGEIILPSGQEIADPGTDEVGRKVQFARTPFSVAFQSSWFKFKLVTVHIFYGKSAENSPEMEHRRREIESIANYLAERQNDQEEALGDEANFILLGDFNIVSPQHQTMQALENAGFNIPQGIKDAPSSLSGKHHYDQIAFRLADNRFEFGSSGVFDMFDVIYRDEDTDQYVDVVRPEAFEENSDGEARNREQKKQYFRSYYRKHQMSDHKLLWCEIKTDFSDDYLEEIRTGTA
jgi:endonuclease/exonuclease/phosphatase family metal-dependent hydrolase